MIFLNDDTLFFAVAFLICSAVSKSTRYFFAIASVISSPASGIIPKAIMLPSFTMEISDVPAPTSMRAIFSRRKRSGIARLIAAIGSSVRLTTRSPASSTAEYNPSTTSSGKKVVIISTPIEEATCCSIISIG